MADITITFWIVCVHGQGRRWVGFNNQQQLLLATSTTHHQPSDANTRSLLQGHMASLFTHTHTPLHHPDTHLCVRWSPCTPTLLMGRKTAKACQISSYRPNSLMVLV